MFKRNFLDILVLVNVIDCPEFFYKIISRCLTILACFSVFIPYKTLDRWLYSTFCLQNLQNNTWLSAENTSSPNYKTKLISRLICDRFSLSTIMLLWTSTQKVNTNSPTQMVRIHIRIYTIVVTEETRENTFRQQLTVSEFCWNFSVTLICK